MRADHVEQMLRHAVSLGGQSSSDFDLNADVPRDDRSSLRPAAVLIGVKPGPRGATVYLTKRASALKHHPGQIAFPGGKMDAADGDDPAATALREAHEEIGLPEGHAQVLGALPFHETVTNFKVTPIVAMIPKPFLPDPEDGEVEEVFTVPLAHFLEPSNFQVQSRMWQGRARHYYVVPYGPYYVWGATARILRVLADRVSTWQD